VFSLRLVGRQCQRHSYYRRCSLTIECVLFGKVGGQAVPEAQVGVRGNIYMYACI